MFLHPALADVAQLVEQWSPKKMYMRFAQMNDPNEGEETATDSLVEDQENAEGTTEVEGSGDLID
jgi:hypothetical protein